MPTLPPKNFTLTCYKFISYSFSIIARCNTGSVADNSVSTTSWTPLLHGYISACNYFQVSGRRSKNGSRSRHRKQFPINLWSSQDSQVLGCQHLQFPVKPLPSTPLSSQFLPAHVLHRNIPQHPLPLQFLPLLVLCRKVNFQEFQSKRFKKQSSIFPKFRKLFPCSGFTSPLQA